MNSVEIDDEVFAELSRRAVGFHVAPNDVIRRILDLPDLSPTVSLRGKEAVASAPSNPQTTSAEITPLVRFVRSDLFRRSDHAVDRFLLLLGWLFLNHRNAFADAILEFRRGNRRYFAKSQKEIEQSGAGITAKAIPQTPFWVLTTLDNRSKRAIIEDLLQTLRYSRGDINAALAELRDSTVRRRGRNADTFRQLKEMADQLSTIPEKT